MMTPQEIVDHKRTWIDVAYRCTIHTDLRSEALRWLKGNLMVHQYGHRQYTDVYEDTIYFEYPEDRDYFYQWYENRFDKALPREEAYS